MARREPDPPDLLLGCDFSSAPTRRKPVVVATGALEGGRVHLHALHHFDTLDAWGAWLGRLPSWLGAFDFPFGLPRALVHELRWPCEWRPCIAHYAGLPRSEIRAAFSAFCARRPPGAKMAHRVTDGPAGASPSMKWVNPPVAYMMHAGVPRLLDAGAWLPGLHGTAGPRVALEGYPGLLARAVLGRESYKADSRARQTPAREAARRRLVAALQAGEHRWALPTALNEAQQTLLVADPSGDRLDAVLCLVFAAWARLRRDSPGPGFGLPAGMDPLEGWIVGA